MPENATVLEMVPGGLYRNSLDAELRLIGHAYLDNSVRKEFALLVPDLWVARSASPYGPERWLVTAEGMAQCGYARVAEEFADITERPTE